MLMGDIEWIINLTTNKILLTSISEKNMSINHDKFIIIIKLSLLSWLPLLILI